MDSTSHPARSSAGIPPLCKNERAASRLVSSHRSEPGPLALDRDSFGKPRKISAVIVDHLLLLHPSNSVSAVSVEPLSLPRLVAERVVPTRPGHARPRVDLEVPVMSGEGSLGPIRLHPPSLRRPVIGIPQAAVHPHRLPRWERNSRVGVVGEHPHRDVVNQESALRK